MKRQVCALSINADISDLVGWPMKKLTWDVYRVPPGLETEYFREDIETALGRWSDVCGIEFAEAGNVAPNLLFTAEHLGGPLGTLGMAQMPYRGISASASLKIILDRSERWTHGDNWTRDGVPVAPVLCHEIGHAIGLPHAPAVAPPDLMDPSLQEGIVKPQTDWDVVTAQKLYGKPATNTPDNFDDEQPDTDAEDIRELLELFRQLLQRYINRRKR